jgi:hypothetical protein
MELYLIENTYQKENSWDRNRNSNDSNGLAYIVMLNRALCHALKVEQESKYS